MKKGFVLPRGGGDDNDGNPRRSIVGSARDLAESSAPQAFGVRSVRELKQFLRLNVFDERHQATAEDRLRGSGLVSRF